VFRTPTSTEKISKRKHRSREHPQKEFTKSKKPYVPPPKEYVRSKPPRKELHPPTKRRANVESSSGEEKEKRGEHSRESRPRDRPISFQKYPKMPYRTESQRRAEEYDKQRRREQEEEERKANYEYERQLKERMFKDDQRSEKEKELINNMSREFQFVAASEGARLRVTHGNIETARSIDDNDLPPFNQRRERFIGTLQEWNMTHTPFTVVPSPVEWAVSFGLHRRSAEKICNEGGYSKLKIGNLIQLALWRWILEQERQPGKNKEEDRESFLKLLSESPAVRDKRSRETTTSCCASTSRERSIPGFQPR